MQKAPDVRAIRSALGVTQAWLAALLNMSPATLSRVENGHAGNLQGLSGVLLALLSEAVEATPAAVLRPKLIACGGDAVALCRVLVEAGPK